MCHEIFSILIKLPSFTISVYFQSIYLLQNTNQQEKPPYSVGKLVFPPLFDEINDIMSQNLFQKSIEKEI